MKLSTHAALAVALAAAASACASTGVTDATPLAPSVSHVSELPLRWAPNGKSDVKRLARGHEAFVALLRMDAGAAVPVHRDASEEYIYVLSGSGVLTIDGKAYPLKPGSVVFMPSGAEVSYTNGPSELVALQVFADPTSAAKYQRWSSTRPEGASPQP